MYTIPVAVVKMHDGMVTIKKIKAQVSQSPVHGVIEVMHHFVVIWDTSGGYNFCSTYMYILFSQSTILNSLPMIYTGGLGRVNVGAKLRREIGRAHV